MYQYSIKVSVSEKWAWKCSHCGKSNTRNNSRMIHEHSTEAADVFVHSNAKDRCAEKTNAELHKLETEYFSRPQYRDYHKLALNLSCEHCGHREVWASPNAFTAPSITPEKQAQIETMSVDNLPTLIEHKFTPIPASERQKQEDKHALIFVAAFIVFLLIFIISQNA